MKKNDPTTTEIPQLVAIYFEGVRVLPKPTVASFPQPSCDDGQSLSQAEKNIFLVAFQHHSTVKDNHHEANSALMVTPTTPRDLFQACHTLLPSIRSIPLALDAFNYTKTGEVRKIIVARRLQWLSLDK